MIGLKQKEEYTDWRTERELETLTEAQATIVWVEQGFKKDGNPERIKNDWYDAKRNIAFMLADEIIEACERGMSSRIPPYYFPYLHNISLEEYKQIKAYHAWENSGDKSGDSPEYYYKACGRLNNILSNSDIKNLPLMTFEEYIRDSFAVKEKIKKRKAFWQHLGGKNDSRAHWQAASGFVDTVYQGLFDVLDTNSSTEFTHIQNFVLSRPHLLNMMEFFIFAICLL